MKKNRPPQQYCKCGCGSPTTYRKGKYRTYLHGHGTRKKRELVLCACGCGNRRISIPTGHYRVRYIIGHHRKGKPSPNKGRIFTEEWKRNMSLSLLKVWRRKKKLLLTK